MEESPHKCPVCARSFNQRSNLKTHLLTHTDHKPYECNSCGKVFRRNCDLRRHALTHAVGDVPPEVLAAEGIQITDSPPTSPSHDMSLKRPRTPSAERREEPQVVHVQRSSTREEYTIRHSSPTPERTQCHESSGYTMRPQQLMEHPQLQIRRDLHKPSTVTSLDGNFLGGFRRRIPEPPDGKVIHRTHVIHSLGPPIHHSQASGILKPPDEMLCMPGPSNCMASDLSMGKRDSDQVVIPPAPPKPPPKKTGFSIEDIMRR